jgi:WD40 repeat protein
MMLKNFWNCILQTTFVLAVAVFVPGRSSGQEMVFHITRICYSRDGNRVAASGSVRSVPTIKVWEVATGKCLATLELPENLYIGDILFLSDGKTLISGGMDKLIRLWDTETWKQRAAFKSNRASIHCLALSPDATTLASGDAGLSGCVRFWDLASGKETVSFPGHAYGVDSLAFSPEGKLLAAVPSRGPVNIWDMTAKKRWSIEPHGDPESEEDNTGVLDCKFSPDKRTLALAEHHQHMISLYDISTKKEKAQLLGHKLAVLSLAFSPNGKYLASVSPNTPFAGHDPIHSAVIKLWDVAMAKEIGNLELKSAVRSIVFSPDGKTLALGGDQLQYFTLSKLVKNK